MDLRLALRGIRRAPGFAALVIVTMALGIGATTTMFSVIRAVFLRPLPFPNPDRLVTLWESDIERGVAQRRVSPANFVDWEAQSSVFEHIGALPNWTGAVWPFNIVGKDGMERVNGIYASSGFFRALGVPAAQGRTFEYEDDRRRGVRNVVISHSYWRDRFAGDHSVVGKTLEVDTFRGGSFTIIGVMPEGFDFPRGAKIWLSLADWGGGPLPSPDAAERCCPWYAVFARLKPDATIERAEAELTAIAQRVSQRYPQSGRVTGVKVIPLRDSIVGQHRLTLWTLFGAVSCLLLIGCANVANLMLSRGVARRNEVLTRMALGATRRRIARQLAVESLLLCGLGSIAGLLVSVWAQKSIARVMVDRVPFIEDTQVDWAVLGFGALLTLISGLICGMFPLVDLNRLNWTGRGQTEGERSRRLRKLLVVAEIALAVTLVATAGLLIRTVTKLHAVEVGFRMERILTLSLDVTTGPLRGRGNAARFLEALLPRIAALRGVKSVGAATGMPLLGGPAEQAITREDRRALLVAESPQVVQGAVTPGYFATLGMAIRKGRGFTENDSADANLVAILNETAARRYWPGEDPIGKRFAIGSRERFGSFRALRGPGDIEWREIVGVVADIRSAGFAAQVQPEVYYCYRQFPLYDPKLVLRSEGDSMALAAAIRREIAAVNNRAVVTRVRTMEQVASESIREPRLRAALVGLFSGLALILGMLGIYGVMSYTVARRTQEFGIRMALGAQRGQVSRMVVGEALRWTAAGIGLGLAGALAGARAISSLLFGVAPADIPTLVGTCLLLFAAALAASYLPARRAMHVDPAVALRGE